MYFIQDGWNGSLRQNLKLENKFVVGFCGNHGVAQGLPSIMEAADLLRQHEDMAFLFVGEGPVKQQLLDTKQLKNLDNVLMLPQVLSRKFLNTSIPAM